MSEIQKSPSWDKHSDVNWPVGGGPLFRDGFPFREGFPQVGPDELRWFELITRDGKRHIVRVDFSTQYRAEGLRWLTKRDSPIYEHTVIAWKEVSEEQDSCSSVKNEAV